jgi:hypothetical protein
METASRDLIYDPCEIIPDITLTLDDAYLHDVDRAPRSATPVTTLLRIACASEEAIVQELVQQAAEVIAIYVSGGLSDIKHLRRCLRRQAERRATPAAMGKLPVPEV